MHITTSVFVAVKGVHFFQFAINNSKNFTKKVAVHSKKVKYKNLLN